MRCFRFNSYSDLVPSLAYQVRDASSGLGSKKLEDIARRRRSSLLSCQLHEKPLDPIAGQEKFGNQFRACIFSVPVL